MIALNASELQNSQLATPGSSHTTSLPQFRLIASHHHFIGIPCSKRDKVGLSQRWRGNCSCHIGRILSNLPLHDICPPCKFQYPQGPSQQANSVLQRIRLNAALTRCFLFKIGWAYSLWAWWDLLGRRKSGEKNNFATVRKNLELKT